jgi:predicted F0F1-ATPase subunit
MTDGEHKTGSRGDLQGRTRKDADRFEKREPPAFWHSLALIGSVGWPIALGSVGGALLGRMLDHHYETGVRYTLVLLTLGTAVSSFFALRAVMRHGSRGDA